MLPRGCVAAHARAHRGQPTTACLSQPHAAWIGRRLAPPSSHAALSAAKKRHGGGRRICAAGGAPARLSRILRRRGGHEGDQNSIWRRCDGRCGRGCGGGHRRRCGWTSLAALCALAPWLEHAAHFRVYLSSNGCGWLWNGPSVPALRGPPPRDTRQAGRRRRTSGWACGTRAAAPPAPPLSRARGLWRFCDVRQSDTAWRSEHGRCQGATALSKLCGGLETLRFRGDCCSSRGRTALGTAFRVVIAYI